MFVSTNSISSQAAWQLTGLARDHAIANGWKVAVSVVDAQGIPMAMLRMDGVSPPVMDFAADKAYTASTMRRSTPEFFDRMNATPRLRLGLTSRPRFLVWGGGLPIMLDGNVLGGIGVSGALEDQDTECAKVALDAIGFVHET